MTLADPARSSGVTYAYGTCGTPFLASRLNRPAASIPRRQRAPSGSSPVANRTNHANIFGPCCSPNRDIPAAALLGATSPSEPPPRAPSGVLEVYRS